MFMVSPCVMNEASTANSEQVKRTWQILGKIQVASTAPDGSLNPIPGRSAVSTCIVYVGNVFSMRVLFGVAQDNATV